MIAGEYFGGAQSLRLKVRQCSADAATDGKDRITVDGRGTNGALYLGGGNASMVVVDSLLVYKNSEVATTTQLMTEQQRAKSAEYQLNKKVSNSNAVAGGVITNVIAHELTPDELKAQGISFTGTVSQTADGVHQTRVGVSKNLGEGFTVGAGVGTSDGKLNWTAGKNIDINENFHVGLIASTDGSKANLGPTASVTNNDGKYGVGVSTFGPTVIVNGVSVPVGPLAAPNLLVVGLSGAYNSITGKTDAKIKALTERAEIAEKNYNDLKTQMIELKAQMEEMMKTR
jgi:hypothetical protein